MAVLRFYSLITHLRPKLGVRLLKRGRWAFRGWSQFLTISPSSLVIHTPNMHLKTTYLRNCFPLSSLPLPIFCTSFLGMVSHLSNLEFIYLFFGQTEAFVLFFTSCFLQARVTSRYASFLQDQWYHCHHYLIKYSFSILILCYYL